MDKKNEHGKKQLSLGKPNKLVDDDDAYTIDVNDEINKAKSDHSDNQQIQFQCRFWVSSLVSKQNKYTIQSGN